MIRKKDEVILSHLLIAYFTKALISASIFGKWLAIILMLVGIGTIGMLTSALTNFFVKENSNEESKLDQLQNELVMQRHLVEKQAERIEELHKMVQELLKKY